MSDLNALGPQASKLVGDFVLLTVRACTDYKASSMQSKDQANLAPLTAEGTLEWLKEHATGDFEVRRNYPKVNPPWLGRVAVAKALSEIRGRDFLWYMDRFYELVSCVVDIAGAGGSSGGAGGPSGGGLVDNDDPYAVQQAQADQDAAEHAAIQLAEQNLVRGTATVVMRGNCDFQQRNGTARTRTRVRTIVLPVSFVREDGVLKLKLVEGDLSHDDVDTYDCLCAIL